MNAKAADEKPEGRPPHRWQPLAGPEDTGEHGMCACGAWRKPLGKGRYLYTASGGTDWSEVNPPHAEVDDLQSLYRGDVYRAAKAIAKLIRDNTYIYVVARDTDTPCTGHYWSSTVGWAPGAWCPGCPFEPTYVRIMVAKHARQPVAEDVAVYQGPRWGALRVIDYAQRKLREDRRPVLVLGCERHLG